MAYERQERREFVAALHTKDVNNADVASHVYMNSYNSYCSYLVYTEDYILLDTHVMGTILITYILVVNISSVFVWKRN